MARLSERMSCGTRAIDTKVMPIPHPRSAAIAQSEQPAEQSSAATARRCALCLQIVTSEHEIFRIRGLPVHLRCAAHRRRRFLAALGARAVAQDRARDRRRQDALPQGTYKGDPPDRARLATASALLFDHREHAVFGLLATAGSLAAFLAPPFTGLDTLPALGVAAVALGPDGGRSIVVLAVIVGVAGVFLELVLGKAALSGIQKVL
jgi:hypothetical protein